MSAYAASKAAAEAMCDSWRIELAHHGVDVTCIHPLWVTTPMVERGRDSRAFARLCQGMIGPLAGNAAGGGCAADRRSDPRASAARVRVRLGALAVRAALGAAHAAAGTPPARRGTGSGSVVPGRLEARRDSRCSAAGATIGLNRR